MRYLHVVKLHECGDVSRNKCRLTHDGILVLARVFNKTLVNLLVCYRGPVLEGLQGPPGAPGLPGQKGQKGETGGLCA